MSPQPERSLGASSRSVLVFLLALLPTICPKMVDADPRIRDHVTEVDYFTAKQDPRAAHLIETVERFHFGADTFGQAFAAKKYGRAIQELEFVLRYAPNHPRALHLLGVTCRRNGDVFYPIRYFERALARYPQHAYTRAQYGSYLLSIGQSQAGLRELRLAVAADSTLWMARAWLHEAEASVQSSPDDVP